jgi:hypothetical protein
VSTIKGVISLSFFFHRVTFFPEGVIVGFCNFAWGSKSRKKLDLGLNFKKIDFDPLPDTCAKNSASIDGGLSADPGVRAPIGASRIFLDSFMCFDDNKKNFLHNCVSMR